MSASNPAPIAIYYEHPDWFRPLFRELERRGIDYLTLDPRSHGFNPGESNVPFSLLFNRMSPSAYLRNGVQGIFYTHAYLAHLDRLNIPVVNGSKAFAVETSKSRQLTLLESLGLDYPATRVINHPCQIAEATKDLRFPVVVKANIGGSGAGIVKYESLAGIESDIADSKISFGIDHTALVQEFTPARGQMITRVETLGGKFLYAIQIHMTGESFNLCPADICQRSDGATLQRSACPIDAPRTGMRVNGVTPPQNVIDACEAIVQAAGIDVGGIEYMIDDRDGRLVYYDVNALSNFVADAKEVVGFDPFVRLVDYLEARSAGRIPRMTTSVG